MFVWNVEDMALRNQERKICDYVETVSREDKISFVDGMQDGKLSYLLSLIAKFDKEKDSMPKDSFGEVKSVSLKAWIKRNDIKYSHPLLDDRYYYGQYYLLGSKRYIQSKHKYSYDTYEDLVDEAFYRQLKKCEQEEENYFLAHDEYSVLKQRLRDKKYITLFGVHLSFWNTGRICVCDDNDNERDITLEELKDLLAKCEQLDALVEKLTAETHIVY